MTPRRLVLLVEGYGDVEAAPVLVDRLLKDYSATAPVFDAVFLDWKPFRVGGYPTIRRNPKERKLQDFGQWRRFLSAAVKRPRLGGCLLLLDGDNKTTVQGQAFCAMHAARLLAAEAQKVGAGKLFSLGIVFACREFESWLIPGIDSLLGKPATSGRANAPTHVVELPPNPESAPRDAKGWLCRVMPVGYDPLRDQANLTRQVDLGLVREQQMRSFRRMESALRQLVNAIRSGDHVVTPTG